MLFILYAIEGGLHTELSAGLNKLHVLWQLVLFLHLAQPIIILLFVFGVGDLNHVLTKQAHEFWAAHRLLDLS